MKVFQINEYDWVVAKDIYSAIIWYETQYGEEIDKDEVRECDLEKEGQYIEFTDKYEIERLETLELEESIVKIEGQPRKRGFGSLMKMGGEWYIKVPFKDVLPTNENIEPYITASTEY